MPEITFRHPTSIRDRLVNSHYHTDADARCCGTKGTHCCSHCNVCQFLVSYGVLPCFGTRKWFCKHYVDCTTEGIVYLWMCECGSYYVGKTIRSFQVRAREHLYAINICDLLSPLGRHRVYPHGYRPIRVCFTALNRVHPDPRG